MHSSLNGELERGSGTLTIVGIEGEVSSTFTLWSGGYTGTLSVDGIHKDDTDIPDGAKLTTIRTVDYDFTT